MPMWRVCKITGERRSVFDKWYAKAGRPPAARYEFEDNQGPCAFCDQRIGHNIAFFFCAETDAETAAATACAVCPDITVN